MSSKKIMKKVKGYRTKDGAGVSLIRVIGHDDVTEADPFLMLDAFDSKDPADYIRGFPMHPHRGIETVTYLIDGRIDHKDSLGNSGTIHSGESQWMTAGRGILHEEMPKVSERLFGLQVWVNLPKKDKMTGPRYMDISNDDIGIAEKENSKVRVIAGTYDGVKGASSKYVDVTMLDVTIDSDQELSIPLENRSTALVYTLEGDGGFGSEYEQIENRTAAIFGEGDTLDIKAGKDGVRFMLYAGRPLKEPVAWGGPIVMNTRAELEDAFAEMRRGTFIQ